MPVIQTAPQSRICGGHKPPRCTIVKRDGGVAEERQGSDFRKGWKNNPGDAAGRRHGRFGARRSSAELISRYEVGNPLLVDDRGLAAVTQPRIWS
jgi:hypothetical protein